MKSEHASSEASTLVDTLENELLERRSNLARLYDNLPAYGSAAFWLRVEEPDRQQALPLEVLVKCTRLAIAKGDDLGRNRLIEVMLRRIQASNEYWTYHVLNHVPLRPDEHSAFLDDLYADLCERLIRALMDPSRSFWEENFQHCLQFERRHVYAAWMTREGRGSVQKPQGKHTERIPRALISSFDSPGVNDEGDPVGLPIEDEQARQALLAVEHSDLPRLLVQLPTQLKSVLWLLFWEGRTEKDAARILGVSDRTVRNRLQAALKILRVLLHTEMSTNPSENVEREVSGP